MVQLVVYPSFAYYDLDKLKQWHQRYTRSISLLVVPLMFGQLLVSLYSALWNTSAISIIKLSLVALVWVLTFAFFVPLHNAVAKASKEESKSICQHLVQKNWSRTLVWTIIFVLGMSEMLTSDLF